MLCKEQIFALKKCVLFDGVDIKAALKTLENRVEVAPFSNHENVYTRNRFNNSVGIIIKGSVEVYKDEQKLVMLNRITEGGFFGAAALFADKKEYVSVLVAKGESEILFIPFNEFREILTNNPTFALNYIRFLSGRIEFLNKKIDEFTAPDTSKKLCRYLAENAKLQEDRYICQVKSIVELSKSLNMGRASLYRSFDELENKGIITRNGKNIIIDDIDKLKKRGF